MRPQHQCGHRDHFADHLVVLTKGPVQFIVIVLKLVFLKQYDAGPIRDIHAHPVCEKGEGEERKVDGER